MNILCVDQFSSIGGGQSCLLDLLPAFLDRGWSVQVALPGPGPFQERVRSIGIQTHLLSPGSYTSMTKPPRETLRYAGELPRLAWKLIRICRRQNIDLLYVNGPRFLPAAACASRLLSIESIFHCHHRITQPIAVRLTGEALRLSRARVIACCQYAVKPLRDYIDRERLRVIYNGVGEMAVPRSNPAGTRRRIGVIGRIEPEKGQLEFVAAARSVVSRFPDCTFSIVGEPLFSGAGYLQKVKQASGDLPIEFLGWRDDIANVFAGLDLLVVPSTDLDATPRVILEAFAAGVPVVAFPAGGIPELIEDGQTGFLASEFNPAALGRCIETVLKSCPEDLDALVARARARWEEQFTLGAFQKQICSIVADRFTPGESRKPQRTSSSLVPLVKRPHVEPEGAPSAVPGQSR
jgi:glycosyltransferase involved in cell wall biosynthesis